MTKEQKASVKQLLSKILPQVCKHCGGINGYHDDKCPNRQLH
jgi:hypothetical protein